MRNLNTLFIVIFNLLCLTLLAGCKAGEKVVSKTETITTVKERDVPIPIPERKASAVGAIRVDADGNFHLDRLEITNDNHTKVDISIDDKGNLKAEFVAEKDTAKAKVTDTSTVTKEDSEKVVEKKPPFWKRFFSDIGSTLFVSVFLLGVGYCVIKKFKKLWQ